MRLIILGLLLGTTLIVPTWAYTTGGGGTFGTGGDGGCCGKAINDLIKNRPDDEQAAALKIYKDLFAIDEERLAYLKAKGDQVCLDVECKEMEATFVQQLVTVAADRKQRNEANQIAAESNTVAWIGAAAAIVSAFIAFLALIVSWRSNTQSHKNEAAIERLQGRDIL